MLLDGFFTCICSQSFTCYHHFVGFLCTNDANSAGNYGMWDQVRALEFVKENIRSFRGNPGIITIFGQNTGAASVGLQILSPRTVSKLFNESLKSEDFTV